MLLFKKTIIGKEKISRWMKVLAPRTSIMRCLLDPLNFTFSFGYTVERPCKACEHLSLSPSLVSPTMRSTSHFGRTYVCLLRLEPAAVANLSYLASTLSLAFFKEIYLGQLTKLEKLTKMYPK